MNKATYVIALDIRQKKNSSAVNIRHPTVSISIMNMEENYLPIQMIAQTIRIPKVRKGTQRAKQLGFLEMAFTANNIEKNTGAILHN